MMKKLTLLAAAMLTATVALAAAPAPHKEGIEGKDYKWNAQESEKMEALKKKGRIKEGEEAYEACGACHLPSGAGRPDGTFPQLAGQHTTVLIKQMTDVRASRRRNDKMLPFVDRHVLSPQDIADIAVYLNQGGGVFGAAAGVLGVLAAAGLGRLDGLEVAFLFAADALGVLVGEGLHARLVFPTRLGFLLGPLQGIAGGGLVLVGLVGIEAAVLVSQFDAVGLQVHVPRLAHVREAALLGLIDATIDQETLEAGSVFVVEARLGGIPQGAGLFPQGPGARQLGCWVGRRVGSAGDSRQQAQDDHDGQAQGRAARQHDGDTGVGRGRDRLQYRISCRRACAAPPIRPLPTP